jgi:hypothetical protein
VSLGPVPMLGAALADGGTTALQRKASKPNHQNKKRKILQHEWQWVMSEDDSPCPPLSQDELFRVDDSLMEDWPSDSSAEVPSNRLLRRQTFPRRQLKKRPRPPTLRVHKRTITFLRNSPVYQLQHSPPIRPWRKGQVRRHCSRLTPAARAPAASPQSEAPKAA